MSAASCECVLFAGPSLHETEVRAEGIELRAPARRGEIAALTRERSPSVVALADGAFHQTLAVGHVELREAARHGWQVWGLSSMGAIRACEMRHLGVRGYGAVYQRFVNDPDFSDDEVALVHSPEAPYQPLSEPLIHIRLALDALVERGLLPRGRRRTLLTSLKKMWFGDRTLGWLRAALLQHAEPRTIDDFLSQFQRHRLKSIDLERFLSERPWRVEGLAESDRNRRTS